MTRAERRHKRSVALAKRARKLAEVWPRSRMPKNKARVTKRCYCERCVGPYDPKRGPQINEEWAA